MPEPSLYYQSGLTLPDLLERAIRSHEDLFIGYYDKNGNLLTQTYKDLHSKAKMIAAGLYDLGLKQGDKLIIATQNNQETIELLWGCFLLGLVPTVLQPPVTFSGYNPAVVKLMNVYAQLECPYIFMSAEVKDSGELPKGKIKHTGELHCSGTFSVPVLKPDDLAFIQFSSGSTGDPKGIMLTHGNLMVNMDAIRIGLDLHYPDHIGNWMPLFHDMGLIGYHLTPLYSIAFQYQVETNEFIMNPGLWLNLMSEHRIAVTGCTNFGLALVLRYLNRKKPSNDWNFSGMKAMLNGAEPISVKIMEDIVSSLQPFGFRPEAMMPVYGMAEATLAISFSPLMKSSVVTAFDAFLLDRENRADRVDPDVTSARILSEVGVALNDVEIRIVDENDLPLQEGTAGHILLKGPSITKGYYKNPEATASAFSGEWLRTGDIGFFFEGRLYISGRYKDIIFKNGRNYFANDLEIMACTLTDINYGKVCFGGTTSKETGQDKVIVFVAGIPETKFRETFRELRALLRSNIGITVDEMVLVKSNEIPKTSSGKLQRFKLMRRYVNGELLDHTLKADMLDSL
jgi:acyl-CoA synthetase (AMP-forming)/AMP-acid ligase II